METIMSRSCLLIVALGAAAIAISGCQKPQMQVSDIAPQYDRQLPYGQLALRKITDPAQIPDFTSGCHSVANLSEAIDRSLNYMSKPSSKGVGR